MPSRHEKEEESESFPMPYMPRETKCNQEQLPREPMDAVSDNPLRQNAEVMYNNVYQRWTPTQTMYIKGGCRSQPWEVGA